MPSGYAQRGTASYEFGWLTGAGMPDFSSFSARHESTSELAQLVRKAVMISMSMTGRVGTWTHDDYDIAHAALNELARRASSA